jgi:glycosyltransferase involved in cell wall biosynthesis
MRALVVDLLCNTPYYCDPLVRALTASGVDAELASPAFYLEPHYLDETPRAPWVRNFSVHASRPRAVRVASRSVEASWNFLRLLSRVASGRYDVVHVQWIPLEGRSSTFMRLLRRRCDETGTLLVHTAHNAVPHDRPRSDMTPIRRNLELAHLLVAQTDHVAAELADIVRPSMPIEVIPHGPLFADRNLPNRSAASARLGIRSSGPTVLFLGLLRPYKGLDLLADAWPRVKAAVPDARLLVVGKRGDRGVDGDLDRLRAEAGVDVEEGYVSVAAMLDYHAVSDVVVVPYRRISQSGALMTAIGLGRPVVLTPIAGLLEQVRDIESAVVAAEVTGNALADSIVSSLRDRSELARAAARDRRLIADSQNGWRSVGRATAAAFERGLRRLEVRA